MIYLFSQIAISLALAAIVGGAIGWLAHRARVGKEISRLKSVISRQHQQVNEAQTQVSILTGDFDDLKHHSEAEIASLKQDNQKIPALNQNLEKSQLLVRQLMQQHKSEMGELVDENEKLASKAKQSGDREQAITKLQAELDIERRRNQKLSSDSVPKTNGLLDSAQTAEESQTELALDENQQPESAANAHDASNNKNSSAPVASASDSANSNETDKDANTIENASIAASDDQKPVANEAAAANVSTNFANSQNTAKAQSDDDEHSNTGPTAAETEAELKQLRDQLAADAPSKDHVQVNVHSTKRPHKLSETSVDEHHLEPLFDRVEHQDDLKQIFGIGPVTEKTLNKLGITAYSQLAELKQHDIEKIAEALQIFPGRIERDNWVGGARAQLEEVLEDL